MRQTASKGQFHTMPHCEERSLMRTLLGLAVFTLVLAMAACSGSDIVTMPIPAGLGRVQGTVTYENSDGPTEAQILLFASPSKLSRRRTVPPSVSHSLVRAWQALG